MKKIAFILLFLMSCSTVKLDNKAVDRVSANVDLLNKVGVKWEKLHPLIAGAYREKYVHDTTVIHQPAKIILDEMRVRVIVDSMSSITDSLQDNLKNKLTNAYNLGVKYAEDYYRSLPPKRVVDTVKRETPDLRHEGILNDSINNQAVTIGNLNGKVEQLQKENKSWSWRMLGMIGIMLLMGIIIGLLIKAKIL